MPRDILSHADRHKRRQDVIQYVREGATLEEAGLKFGITVCTVKNMFEDAGTPLPHTGKGRLPSLSSFRIVALLMCGDRPIDIAKQFNVSPQRVNQLKNLAIEAGLLMPSEESR